MIKTIEFKLGMEWSPAQISGWLSEFQKTNISHEAIYLTFGLIKRLVVIFTIIFANEARNTTSEEMVNRRVDR